MVFIFRSIKKTFNKLLKNQQKTIKKNSSFYFLIRSMKLSVFPIYFITELKEYCRTTSDCRTMAYICRKELCECAQGYKPDEMNKTCVGGKFLLLFFIVVYMTEDI